jgi:hypothetical protein
MPLNISIDVDGTLLEANELPALNVREDLLKLKSKGHRLQLRSTGGADYAKKMAAKHNVADLFESYATKPDVVIDDIPESARPVATIKVDKNFLLHQAIELLESKVEGCLESVLCPSQELIQLVTDLREYTPQARTILYDFIPGGFPMLPIPFFGNIESARVITVGLNPAVTEFSKHREWDAPLETTDLTFRLVNYFRLANSKYPPPHGWFSDILEALYVLNCPYRIAAAHVDLCPWTSIAPQDVPQRYWDFIDAQMNAWLNRTIAHAKKTAKLVIILQSPNPSPQQIERQTRAKQIIEGTFGENWQGKVTVVQKHRLVSWSLREKSHLIPLIDFQNTIG